MISNYNDSSAYDLSLFEPQVAEPRKTAPKTATKKAVKSSNTKKTTKKPQTRQAVKNNTAPKRYSEPKRYAEPQRREGASTQKSVLDSYQVTVKRNSKSAVVSKTLKRTIMGAAVLVMFLVANLFMCAECDKLDSQIASLEKEISVAESETVRLNAELNSLIDTEKVTNYAEKKLGMVKAESYQITYIDLSKGDEVVVSGDREVKNDENLGSSIKELFAYIF